eukprot:Pgem_evm1s8506
MIVGVDAWNGFDVWHNRGILRLPLSMITNDYKYGKVINNNNKPLPLSLSLHSFTACIATKYFQSLSLLSKSKRHNQKQKKYLMVSPLQKMGEILIQSDVNFHIEFPWTVPEFSWDEFRSWFSNSKETGRREPGQTDSEKWYFVDSKHLASLFTEVDVQTILNPLEKLKKQAGELGGECLGYMGRICSSV